MNAGMYLNTTESSKSVWSLLLSAFLTLYCSFASQAQEPKDTIPFCVMSYNVENLFDCQHDSLKNDEEFLPHSPRHWTYRKYRKKLDNLAKVILGVGQWNPPALVGLCEVENDSVLHALTRYSLLRHMDYRYLITHSSDARGIDVGLLYQRKLFQPIYMQSLSVPKPAGFSHATRDILHVSGRLLNLDTLDVMVCHFPSRRGGARASEAYRLAAATTVRKCVDSLYLIRQKPQILIMGDFNDYPNNRSIQVILGQNPTMQHLLSHVSQQKNTGSYKYQGSWGLLDHIIVSPQLTDSTAALYAPLAGGQIYQPPFLLISDKKFGGVQPFRTFLGMKYLGGFSDHLPVYVNFRMIY